MDKPLVSVVLSVFNGEKYLAEAIDSILTQTYKNFEFIIINDGSTDSSLEIIGSYNDKRIILISRENKGLIVSLNEGVHKATGKYVARMDADDISLPNRIDKQVKFMQEHESIGICGTAVRVFGENTREHIWKLTRSDKCIKAELLFSSALAHPTVMMRKSLIDQYQLFYSSDFTHAEDFELWTRFALHSNMANLQEPLLRYRILPSSASREADKNVENRYRVMKRIPIPYLEQLRIQRNESQSWLHFNLSTNLRMQASKIDFKDLDSYFALLLTENNHNNIFDRDALKKVLGKKWLLNLYYRRKIHAIFSKYTLYGIMGVAWK